MANNYKKVMTTVTTTGDATIYTVPTETTALVKTAWAYNDSGGAAKISLKINSTVLNTKTGVADETTASFFYLASGDIGVMEAGDILKINNDAQPVNVYLAILEIS
jgi:precorrin-6B methylase 1